MQPSPRLQEFIRQKVEREGKASGEIDWEARKQLWLSQIEALYRQVDEILKEPKEENLISISRSEIPLNEEFIGSYKATKITIRIGKNDVELSPVGTRILAAKGRVDMKGPRGDIMLLLFEKEKRVSETKPIPVSVGSRPPKKKIASSKQLSEYEWVVAKKAIHSKEWPALDQDSFLDALKVVLGDVESDADE